MKKRIAAILAALLAAAFCLGAAGCEKEPTRVDKSGYYCIFRGNGGIEVKVYYKQPTQYEIEYAETTYSFSYREYTKDGYPTSTSSGTSLLMAGPEPGEYTLSTASNDYSFKFVIKEPEDTRVKPNVKFDPNGAIEYEEGVRYVYEYDGVSHYPRIYGEYNGEKILPESHPYNCVVLCENEKGETFTYPRRVGIYTLRYRVSRWSTDAANEKYLGVVTEITVEIVAAAEEEGVVETG